MEKLKTYIKQDNKGLICSAVTVVGTLLGLVMYIITTGNTNGEVSLLLVVTSVTAVVLAVCSCFLLYAEGILSVLSASLSLYSMLMFISSQADSIGYAAAGISDIGYGIQGTLIVGAVCYLAAVICGSISVFCNKKENETH